MGWFKNIIVTFCYVLAGSVFCALVFIINFWPENTDMIKILYQLIVLAVVGSVGNLIFYSRQELSKKKMKVRTIIHYIYIYVANIGCSYLFGWIVPGNVKQVFVMSIMICCVTLMVSYALKKRADRVAELMNEKLNRINLSRNEMEDE